MLEDEGVRDDACTVLLEFRGDRFERRVAGDLDGLSAARRALGRWLGERGVDETVREDLVLAASEAVANAAEHGLAGDAARSVRPPGAARPGGGRRRGASWRCTTAAGGGTAASAADRGRGMRIMRALVDELDVRTGAGTTVLMRRRLGRAS